MRVLITGATGTIGLALADSLRARGDEVVALTRDPEPRPARARRRPSRSTRGPSRPRRPRRLQALAGVEAIVHLLGEPVAQRWTERGASADS